MTRKLLPLILLLAFFANRIDCQEVDTLIILHTDDVHSQMYPNGKGLGGAERRMGMIEAVRAQYRNVLVFDAGDFTQGNSYYCVFKGTNDVGLMNRMGYAAATFGNHEFDLGAKHLADSIVRNAGFPFVLSNYRFDPGFALDTNIVKPYLVLDTCGLRIGIIGLLIDLQGLTAHTEIFEEPGMHYLNPTEVSRSLSAKMKREMGCDFVICLSHLGYLPENPNRPDDLDGAIAELPDVDIVIGGHNHQHRPDSKTSSGTYFVQNKNQGVEIGIFKVPFLRKK